MELFIKLLKPRVLADELRHDLLHEADHGRDFHLAGKTLEFVGAGEGIGVVVFADFGNADAAVVGRKGVLVVGEDFLVELFARAEAAVLDLDVFVRSESCQIYHSSCEVVDLDRFAHVEDEDLVAGAHCGSFHHETAGFRNSHEETCDLRVGNCYRTALCNLLAEAWDH